MNLQDPGNFPGSGSEVVERQRVAKERSAQRVRSWTDQNVMRRVLVWMTASAAGRILDPANSRDKNLTKGRVRCSEDERGDSEHDEGAQAPQWKPSESVCQRTLMRLYTSIPRKEKSGYERRKTKRGGRSSAFRLANSSAAYFPGRNQCTETHCNRRVQEKRKDSSCQICQSV